jgi:hypothetical protein
VKRLVCPVHGRIVAAADTGRLVGRCDLCATEAAVAQLLIEAAKEAAA